MSADDRNVSRGLRIGGPTARRAAVLLAGAAALLLGACGGSSTGGSASTAGSLSTGGANTHVQVARNVRPVPRSLGAGKVIASSSSPLKARNPSGSVDDEVNASGAKTLNPCTLVTQAEAQAILGKQVADPVDASQGPTCIYSTQGAKAPVTLAVQDLHFSTVKPQAQLQDRIALTVAGHRAYCGVAGTATLIVPLSAGRFLSVTAPCPIAASFATKALGRIA
jgi:hypothetical protein